MEGKRKRREEENDSVTEKKKGEKREEKEEENLLNGAMKTISKFSFSTLMEERKKPSTKK